MTSKWIYILIVWLAGASASFAQEDTTQVKSPFITGLRLHYGMIIPHSDKIEHLSHSEPWGVELDLAWHLLPRNIWEYCFCYPRTGFSLVYTNYGNPEIIGSSISLYPYIEPFVGAQRRISMSVRFGIGPAYLTKVYDEETNPENLFFSSRIAFIAMLNVALNYRATDQTNLRLAANYNHISNGAVQEPNLGINYPTFNLGIDHSFRPVEFEDRLKDKSIAVNPKKNRFEAVAILTGKDQAVTDEFRVIYGLSALYSRLVSRVSAFSAGAEWISDHSLRQKIRNLNIVDDSGEYIDHNRVALLFGHELWLGKFIFSQQLGVYVYAPLEPLDPVYQRYGLSLLLGDHFLFGVSIKAHRHVANFLDMRMGVNF